MENNFDINKIHPDDQNGLSEHNDQSPDRAVSTKKYYKRKLIIISLAILILALTTFYYKSNIPGGARYVFKGFNLYAIVKSMIINQVIGTNLTGESDDRVNVLLLGMPGDGHDGPYLTDTIILASIKPSEQEVALISIPRDLIIPLEGYGLPKINSVNAIGEARNIGDGGNYATAAISKVFNIDIQYYVRIDFTGFRQAIDDIGGIEIDVETGFTDHMFPTNNHKTKTISFAQGQQVLDGARALQFARSRHGNNGENSDFARMKRQQKILKAMQNKIFSWRLFINLQTVQEALTSFSSHVATNLKVSELIRLGDLTYSAKNYISKSLDHNGNKLVSDGVGLDGASILQPSSGNYSNITLFINNIFE